MVFRLAPAMPVGSYKTYGISMPKTGHTRIASCEAAGCEAYEFGWRTTVPLLSAQADYIRNGSERRFREEVLLDGMTEFTFYPRQQCFAEHHVQDRPQLYVVRGGDWRANLGIIRKHTRGEFWVEDFAEHQAKLAEQIERG